MSAVVFIFSLLDKVTGPAQKVAKAVGSTGDAAKKAEKAFEPLPGRLGKIQAALADTFGNKAAATMGRFVTGQTNAADATMVANKGFSIMKAGAGAAAGALASVALAAAAAAAVVGAAGIGIGAAGAKYALEMAMFKEQAQFGFKMSLGSAEKAGVTWSYAEKIAGKLGTSIRATAGNIKGLMKQGLGADEAEYLSQIMADMKTATGEEQSPAALADAIKSLKRGEALTPEMLKPLKEAGNQEAVYEKLAATLNIKATTSEGRMKAVDARLNGGALKGAKGWAAYKQAFEAAMGGGEAGTLTKTFRDTTITGSIDKVKDKFENLFAKINTTDAGKSLIGILQKLADAFDPSTEAGKKFLATLNMLAGSVGSLFSRFDSAKMVSGLAAISAAAQSTATTTVGFTTALGGGFTSAMGPANALLAKLSGGEASTANLSKAFNLLGSALGFVAGAALTVVGVVAYVVAKALGFATAVMGAGVAIGVALIDGMINGTDAAKDRLVDRLKALAQLLPDSVRKLLKIQSPSKVFAEIGQNTIKGFSQGVEQEEPRAREVTLSALAPRAPASGQVAQGVRRGGGATYQVNVVNHINGAKDSDEVRQAAKEGTMAATASIFEALALEAGAVGAT